MVENETSVSANFSNMSKEELEAFYASMPYPKDKNPWRDLPSWELGLKIGVASIITLISLTCNTLVLIVLFKKKSLRNVTNMFIINLAIADLLVTLSTAWIHVVDELSVPWLLGAVLCKYNPMITGQYLLLAGFSQIEFLS